MKSDKTGSLVTLSWALVAMAACFQIGFYYGVGPYRKLLHSQPSIAGTEIAVYQSKTVFFVSVAGFAFVLLGLALAIWRHRRKEPIQPPETTRGK